MSVASLPFESGAGCIITNEHYLVVSTSPTTQFPGSPQQNEEFEELDFTFIRKH